jgi:hypothetical protein
MGLQVTAEEVCVGYGVADVVGAAISDHACRVRKQMGLEEPLDSRHVVETLLSLRPGVWHSYPYLLGRVSVAESTLRGRIIPLFVRLGLADRDGARYVRLLKMPPSVVEEIIAVEAKQARWMDAIIQARRYTYFANQTYIALWDGATRNVDRALLFRHRLGLIGVEGRRAQVVVEAPPRIPRRPAWHWYCGEVLYRQAAAADCWGRP